MDYLSRNMNSYQRIAPVTKETPSILPATPSSIAARDRGLGFDSQSGQQGIYGGPMDASQAVGI